MIERTENLRLWLANWFGDDDSDPDSYIEGCELAPTWLDDPHQGESFRAFRDELAVHIRDSSLRPLGEQEPQWNQDEWLRNLFYDLFGPDTPPEDPYPVPADDWGHERRTPYLLQAVGPDPERNGAATEAWLAKRGLTHEDRDGSHRRAEPADYQERLERLTREGARRA